jgi:hypothetical protein
MRKRYWFWGLQILALVALTMLSTSTGYAQLGRKVLPTLSLVKTLETGTSDITTRDTIYVAEPGPGEKRYLALPIYVKNCLDSITDPVTGLTAEPIYSFKFKLQYNRELMRAVGIQKRGALPHDTVVLAKNFNFSWDIDLDPTYKTSTVGSPSANGERIMVTASSALPLPLSPRNNPTFTGCQFRDTAVLVYVLFEVIGQHTGGTAGVNRDQLILVRDSISWNEYEVSRVTPEMIARRFETIQAGVAPSPVFPIAYPNNYGSAVIQITPRPRIDLLPPSQVVTINGDISDYELTSRLQTYFGNVNRIFRNILLVNGIPNSELRNLVVESDQAWLRVDTNAPNIPPGVGQGGDPSDATQRGMFIRSVRGQINFNIVANPAMIPTDDAQDYPTPGIYTGYITIRSTDAQNSAVRLKVVLLVTRNPLESQLDSTTESRSPTGIQLLFRNSAPRPDTTYLTFGTGVAASDDVDTLFGEAEAATAPDSTRFFARWFPPSVTANNPAFRGLIDTRGTTPQATNNETSLDIRNFRTSTTLIYCARFSAGSPQNYPIVIEYDTRNFPNGSALYVRDNQNGAFLSIDMRNATNIGGFRRAITITDARVNGFCIEYTIPSVTQFPEINRGWNLVSLPVSPSNARSEVVFPNLASGKPLQFTQNQYIDADSLEVGRGYFVKYGSTVDRQIAGTQISEIHELRSPFRVRLFEGWNTVGGLSTPTTIEYMSFGPIPGQTSPNRISEVYRYLTDRGYEQTSIIAPGYGYWVKIDRDGYYRLAKDPRFNKTAPKNETYASLNRMTISDNSQKVGTVYFGLDNGSVDAARFELPPVPTRDMFDVRFGNNGFVSTAKSLNGEHVVRFQGVEYPVVLATANSDANYVVTDAATGVVLGTFTRGQGGNVRITNPMTKSVRITTVASSAFELGNAYPNPTSGDVSFDIQSPNDENVNVTLFNSLGSQVRTLLNERVSGHTTVKFSTVGLPAGVYVYKMTTASGHSQIRQLVISK